jgi:hypothetical protein
MATLIARTRSPRFPNSIWARRIAEGLLVLKWSDSSGFGTQVSKGVEKLSPQYTESLKKKATFLFRIGIPPQRSIQGSSGALFKYAALVSSASDGAVTG